MENGVSYVLAHPKAANLAFVNSDDLSLIFDGGDFILVLQKPRHYLGYSSVIQTTYGWVLGAPCACLDCLSGRSGQGHNRCEVVPPVLLTANKRKLIEAVYTSSNWQWVLAT